MASAIQFLPAFWATGELVRTIHFALVQIILIIERMIHAGQNNLAILPLPPFETNNMLPQLFLLLWPHISQGLGVVVFALGDLGNL